MGFSDQNIIPTGLPGGFFVYNAEGDEEIYFADQNVINIFGCNTIEELREHTGNSFKGMVHPDDLDKIHNDITSQTFNSEKKHDYVRYRILTKQGETKYIEDFGHLVYDSNGKKFFYVFIVDVNREEYLNRSRNSFAETQIFAMNQNSDRLTGLMNMATFYDSVQDVISNPISREASKFTFIHFDIVNFKLFNENYGFARGDDLLCRLAYTLKQEFPKSWIARFSNDHFVVCTNSNKPIDHVISLHDTMNAILDGIRVEIKAGIYELDDSCKEVGIACDHARLACNTVKKRYDVIYSTYDVNLFEKLRLHQFVVDNLDIAIEKEYIQVFYQPVIRVATGKICGYEALARWVDPKMGFLSPSDFIPTLEEVRLIHKIDCFVAKKICEDYNTLLSMGEPLVPVSINLSRLDFELCDIFEIVERYRALYDVPREMIDVEITESVLNEDSAQLKSEVARFRKAGYHIWIDDFGSGYSSLNGLLDYDFDVLKLDLEFLRSYDRVPKAAELLKHIVQGAVEMGVEPLQEGVESGEHFEFLKSIGCIRAQGFYFSRPMALYESRKYTRSKGLEWEMV